jgi:hypothetical protein
MESLIAAAAHSARVMPALAALKRAEHIGSEYLNQLP